jgi:DNA-directed RNA polymerase subunit E'/Rpb7
MVSYSMATIHRISKNNGPAKQPQKVFGVYSQSLLTMKMTIKISEIGKNIKQNLETKLATEIEGKCIQEGYIKTGSTKIISYSSGEIQSEYVFYHVAFECMVCHPVEGMLIECQVKTVTKAGIHADVIDDAGNIPVKIFVARDHSTSSVSFDGFKENDKITVKVIGIRFELNDPYICVISQINRQ